MAMFNEAMLLDSLERRHAKERRRNQELRRLIVVECRTENEPGFGDWDGSGWHHTSQPGRRHGYVRVRIPWFVASWFVRAYYRVRFSLGFQPKYPLPIWKVGHRVKAAGLEFEKAMENVGKCR